MMNRFVLLFQITAFKIFFILTIAAKCQCPAGLGLLQQRTSHMLSLALNGLPQGLFWAWSRTPVGVLQHMPLSQWTDTKSHLAFLSNTVYLPLCNYPKYPSVKKKICKSLRVVHYLQCCVLYVLFCVDDLDRQSPLLVANLF